MKCLNLGLLALVCMIFCGCDRSESLRQEFKYSAESMAAESREFENVLRAFFHVESGAFRELPERRVPIVPTARFS